MNVIMQANINAMLSRKIIKAVPKKRKSQDIKMNVSFVSAKIIKRLLSHGPMSGSDLMAALGLKRSPSHFIRSHIESKRILVKNIHCHKNIYKINPDFDVNLFKFYGDNDDQTAKRN